MSRPTEADLQAERECAMLEALERIAIALEKIQAVQLHMARRQEQAEDRGTRLPMLGSEEDDSGFRGD